MQAFAVNLLVVLMPLAGQHHHVTDLGGGDQLSDGLAATVQGTVADVVPAFTNEILGGRSTADQAATVLERMMARRGLEPLAADRDLLATLAAP